MEEGENQGLAEHLALIGMYYGLAQDTYRAKTFNEAAAKITAYPKAISSGAQARAELSRIGDTLEQVINEYLLTGTSGRLQDLETRFIEQKATIDLFTSIYGIGPVTAIKLYTQGLRTLDDLWSQGNLNEKQKLGFIWREHIKLRIPRFEMDLIREQLAVILNPYRIRWEIAGSYRREEPSSGDIDVLVESRPDLNMEGLLALLEPILPVTLASGPTKFMGLIRLSEQYNAHRIDIRLIPRENWPFALMYFTGSQRFNIRMRQRAIAFGLTLNEYRLEDKEHRMLPAATEEDIFRHLRVQYLSPVQRTRNLSALPLV